MKRQRSKRIRQQLRHPKFLWWAFDNWRHGYRWGVVSRCRWCDHTTPFHYSTCRTRVGEGL
jgi:hypothetical protein